MKPDHLRNAPPQPFSGSRTGKSTRRWRQLTVGLVVGAFFAIPGNGCGPFFAQAVFVQQTRPDGSYAAFAGGRIGVPQPGYRLRHLVVAYDWMLGRGLSPSEQAEAVALDKQLYPADGAEEPRGAGLTAWMAARAAAGVPGSPQTGASPARPSNGAPAADALTTDRRLPGDSFQTFANCLDGAFQTAADTLTARRSAHGSGPDQAAFADWVHAQDAVFANCSGDADATPAAAPATAPLWLRQDRAYQVAAARFYAEDYDGAIADLKPIAADASSPWHSTARFVIARATIRRVTIGQVTAMPADLRVGRNAPYSADREKALETYRASLRASLPQRFSDARTQLTQILADPQMQSFHASARGLIDYVNLRLQPVPQGHLLEQRLTARGTPLLPGQFRQGLIDLNYLTATDGDAAPNNGNGGTPGTSRIQSGAGDTGLIAWLATMRDLAPPDTAGATSIDQTQLTQASATAAAGQKQALTGWHTTGNAPWLLAAMQSTAPGAANAADLGKAAAAVPAGSAMHLAASYHALRLGGSSDAARTEITRLLASVESTESRSTVNLFVALRQRSAPTLAAFLADAGTLPAGILLDDTDPEPPTATANAGGLCHVVSPDASTRLFDHTAATVLNARLPLSLLVDAAQTSALPANLRFQVAQSAWTRAVLLDHPELARRLSPVLESCYPAWKPVLDRYDSSAANPDDRRANGLLALMRFASTEPVVRDGEQRPEGFATYSEYRDNWWNGSQAAGPTRDADGKLSTSFRNLPTLFGQLLPSRAELPDPPFVTPADRAAADGEVAQLARIPCASDYFAAAALAWQKAHPTDPRTPDLLGYAERVIRNGCRTDATAALNHQLFDVVKGTYPKSEWASKYTTWE